MSDTAIRFGPKRRVRCPRCGGAVWVCVNGLYQRYEACKPRKRHDIEGWVSKRRAKEIARGMKG